MVTGKEKCIDPQQGLTERRQNSNGKNKEKHRDVVRTHPTESAVLLFNRHYSAFSVATAHSSSAEFLIHKSIAVSLISICCEHACLVNSLR